MAIFSKDNKNDFKTNLSLFIEIIPKQKEVKFLGLILDENLSFNKHIKTIRKIYKYRLNILRILSKQILETKL